MSPAATAPATDNTQLLIAMKGDIATLMERSKNLQEDVRELRNDFESHRQLTEAKASKTGEKLAFFKGEWKAYLAIALVVLEHFWPKAGH